MNLMPLGSLGAVETNGTVSFGLWLPWVSAADGNAVTVKIIHEADQFLQGMAAREFPLDQRPAALRGLLVGHGACRRNRSRRAGLCLGYARPLRVPLHD
jgi:hypothetical protein